MKHKKSISPVVVAVVLILILSLVGGISLVIKHFLPSKERVDALKYFGNQDSEEVALVVNYKVLEDKAKVIDGEAYIGLDTVSKEINSRFYWDKETESLLYALPKEVLTIKPNAVAYKRGGKEYKTDHPILREEEKVLLLSVAFIKEYTKASCEEFKDPARIVFDTHVGKIKQVKTDSACALRQKGGIKSPILKDCEKGETLTLVEELENWSKVASGDGFLGYVEKKKLTKPEEKEVAYKTSLPEYTSLTRDHKISLGWHLMTNLEGNKELASRLEGTKGLNVISPTWFTIKDNQGNLYDRSDKAYVEEAHKRGLEVWALLENINTKASSEKVLASYAARSRMVKAMLASAKTKGFDGINIDLETISEETAPDYLQFIREVSVECRKAGLVLSVDVPVPMSYNSYYGRDEQALVADYLIVMSYDEHYAGSEEAGSVASLPFVENSIEGMLKEVPKEKLINALPFYTRIWTQAFGSGKVSSKTMTMDQAAAYAKEHKMEVYWDGKVGQNVAEKEDDKAQYKIWLEDSKSIDEKMKLVESYDLAGAAYWQLGFENAEVWDSITERLGQ